MNSRFTRLAYICASLGAFLAILLYGSRVMFLDSLLTIEERNLEIAVARACNLLTDTLQQINTTNGDYAGWDETCRFVKEGGREYVTVNLSDAIYSKLRLNLIGFFDNTGKSVYLKAFDYVNNRKTAVPSDLLPHLASGSLLLRMATPESAVNGVLLLEQGPLLITARPVISSDYRGPVRGTVIMGRFLDRVEQKRLALTGQLALDFVQGERSQGEGISRALQTLRSGVSRYYLDAENRDRITAYGLIRDIYGKPALLARVVEDRVIFQEGLRASRLFIIWCAVIGVAAAAAGFFLLERISAMVRVKREGDLRYRSVVERTAEGIVLLDPSSGAILETNCAFCSLLGASAAEVTGKPFSSFVERQEGPYALPEEGRAEIMLRHSSGRVIVADASAGTIPFEGGTALSILLHDVTLRKETEEQLRKAKEELESRVVERTAELERETAQRLKAVEELRERDRLLMIQSRQAAMGEMIGNIAHQWRQPLNTVGLLIQQLTLFNESDEPDPGHLEKSVNQAMEILFHLSRTIDDFRFFFKPNKEKTEFDLDGVIRKSLSLVEPSLRTHSVTTEIMSAEGIVIHGYPNEFSQALMNIFLNARDALVERQIEKPFVMVRVCRERERVLVTVTDNAGGISAEATDRVFDPYFTTKGPEHGTGLGLYMSKVIIEKNMGGSLHARNVEQGAEFMIILSCLGEGAAGLFDS